MKELTILMPCLNEEESLEACIIKAKTFLERNRINGEILIADNGSTDSSIEIALKKGLIEIKNKIIVDSTHTNSMFHHVSAREELIRQAKELRKSVYKIDESMKINCLKK